MGKINLCFFEPIGNTFGSERSMIELIKEISTNEKFFNKINTVCYTPKDSGINELLKDNKIKFYTWHKVDLHKRSKLRIFLHALKLLWFCFSRNIDVLHVNQTGGLAYGLFVKKFLPNISLVCYSRYYDDHKIYVKYGAKLNRIGSIICVSQKQKRDLIEVLPDYESNFRVLYNPFKLKLENISRSEFQNKSNFVVLGRIASEKNLMFIIKSWPKVVGSVANAKLEFYGDVVSDYDVKYLESLKSKILELKLNKLIFFKGYVKDPKDIISGSRAMILASSFEPMGRVIIESFMNNTIPLVSSYDTGALEIIKAMNLDKLVFERENSVSLTNKISMIEGLDYKSYMDIIDTGKKWIINNLDIEGKIADYFNIVSGS
ncbi:glycosyltransferase [Luteibaculum oceani]|uniref:Glycosyltransferase n=1 Tax=Luteibaculum oceani TaxID=1294296 RepID=A0A5C6V7Z7_9FLAO|nr:glycosyltransferase [Luteibaculum oceani]TXC81403.1 glycosyltransferase [Luteibaculum oceani]